MTELQLLANWLDTQFKECLFCDEVLELKDDKDVCPACVDRFTMRDKEEHYCE